MIPTIDTLNAIASHRSALLYARLWGSERTFEALPVLSRAALADVQFSERVFSDAPGHTAIVSGAKPFLFKKTFGDIAKEQYGAVAGTPCVGFLSAHEAMEKAIWCYAKNTLPLVLEPSVSAALSQLEAYAPRTLIADMNTLRALAPVLQKQGYMFEHAILVDSIWGDDAHAIASSIARSCEYVLALPETGAIGRSLAPEAFVPVEGCIVERLHTLVVTKVTEAFPLVRYATGISSSLMR